LLIKAGVALEGVPSFLIFMASNKQKGDYYRRKTKLMFEKRGFYVETTEKLQRCFINGKVLFLKKDICGSDLMAMDGKSLLFIQVKASTKGLASKMKEAEKEFAKYPYPNFVSKVIVGWDLSEHRPQPIEIFL